MIWCFVVVQKCERTVIMMYYRRKQTIHVLVYLYKVDDQWLGYCYKMLIRNILQYQSLIIRVHLNIPTLYVIWSQLWSVIWVENSIPRYMSVTHCDCLGGKMSALCRIIKIYIYFLKLRFMMNNTFPCVVYYELMSTNKIHRLVNIRALFPWPRARFITKKSSH